MEGNNARPLNLYVLPNNAPDPDIDAAAARCRSHIRIQLQPTYAYVYDNEDAQTSPLRIFFFYHKHFPGVLLELRILYYTILYYTILYYTILYVYVVLSIDPDPCTGFLKSYSLSRGQIFYVKI
jgi:hypothetical protein